jgi:signal transduction histidine kinase/CheY-like chemotaxis protein/HPt (histidine-containing phosphotransfer) domain-containing protein
LFRKTLKLLFFFNLTLLVVACLAGKSFAVDFTLALDGDQAEINLSGYSYITEDAMGELSAQDIVQRFRNNIRGQRNKDETIHFDSSFHPYWIAVSVENKTRHIDWVLDFGQLTEGRTGNVSKLLVYEGRSRKIFFNGLSDNFDGDVLGVNDHNLSVPLILDRGSQSILVFYVVPSSGNPIIIQPTLTRSDAYIHSGRYNFDNQYKLVLLIALSVSLALVIVGYFYTHARGFLPLMAYYALNLFWIYQFEWVFLSVDMGLGALAPFIILIQSILISMACFLAVVGKSDLAAFRILTMATQFFAVCAIVILLTIIQLEPIIERLIIFAIATLSILVSLAYVIFNRTPYTSAPSVFLSIWVALFFAGNVIHLLSAYKIIPDDWMFLQAHNLIIFPQLILVFIGVIYALEGESKRQVAEIVKKAQKAQTLLKAKQSKEASDQSRLLRVIEREREIMEELRGREAERSEEMRQAKIAADEANNSKSAFLAVVSHEIRTPMTGIMGMLRLLDDTDLSQEQKEYTRTIKDSGDAMLALLNDILDFSKIEGGGMDLELIPFDLKRVLNGVHMLMMGHAEQKSIDLKIEMDSDIPEVLLGDPTRLRQIFLNLVGNAIKFTSRGHVKIIAKIDADHDRHEPDNGFNALYFAVEDTGIGISQEAQQNLFQPFAQADTSIARKYGGTGLGLSICKKLVEAMGSQIQVYSRESQGTRFYFTIALKQPDIKDVVHSDHKSVQNVQNIAPKHILIVDDNAINRKVVSGLLSKDRHSFESAETGQQALDIIKGGKDFDAILLDIELPDMSGIEVAKTILAMPEPQCDIPLIALTGNVSQNDIDDYTATGFWDYVAKPIDPDRLQKVISNLDESNSISEDTDESTDAKNDSFKESIKVGELKEARASGQSATVSLLDENMLKGLKDGLGGSQTKELIDGLFEKTEEILPLMIKAYASEDRDTLRARAHELKGMAGNFGLSGLSEKAAHIERLCRDEDSDIYEAEQYIELLQSTTERSKAAVNKFLDN